MNEAISADSLQFEQLAQVIYEANPALGVLFLHFGWSVLTVVLLAFIFGWILRQRILASIETSVINAKVEIERHSNIALAKATSLHTRQVGHIQKIGELVGEIVEAGSRYQVLLFEKGISVEDPPVGSLAHSQASEREIELESTSNRILKCHTDGLKLLLLAGPDLGEEVVSLLAAPIKEFLENAKPALSGIQIQGEEGKELSFREREKAMDTAISNLLLAWGKTRSIIESLLNPQEAKRKPNRVCEWLGRRY